MLDTGPLAGRQSGVRTTVDKLDPCQSDVVINLCDGALLENIILGPGKQFHPR